MISDTSKNFLTKLLSFIEKPENYTSAWFAKDAAGNSLLWDNEAAVKFDLLGAIEHLGIADPEGKEEVLSRMRLILQEKSASRPAYFVRTASHGQVLDFIAAILNDQEYVPPAPPIHFPELKAIKMPEIKPTSSNDARIAQITKAEMGTGMIMPTIPAKRGKGRPKGSLNRSTLERLAREKEEKK